MKIEIDKLILNEKDVIEEMLNTGIIPQFYNNKNVLNRLYRYFNGDVDKVLQGLDLLGIIADKRYVHENVSYYTEIQPLSEGKFIEIYKRELQAIKRLNSRVSQRTAFGLLMLKKIVNAKCNRQDNVLRLDSINEIFKYVTNVANKKLECQAWYDMQQNGIINVDWDGNIEIKILEFDGETLETIKNKFDNCNHWFDKLVPSKIKREETIIAIIDGEVEVYEHKGYRGTAQEFSEKHFAIKGTHIKDCCTLKREQQNGVYFFVLDEEWCEKGDYELRKANYIYSMTRARDILTSCKRNPNKKKKLYVRIDGGDEWRTVRIK